MYLGHLVWIFSCFWSSSAEQKAISSLWDTCVEDSGFARGRWVQTAEVPMNSPACKETEAWTWTPIARACELQPLSSAALVEALESNGVRKILLVGDSIMHQLYVSLLVVLQESTQSKDHVPVVTFIASKTMSLGSQEKGGGAQGRAVLQKISNEKPELLIMNWGAHYGLNTDIDSSIIELYRNESKALAQAFVQEISSKPPIVVYRTTPPGHPACGAYVRPFCSDNEHRKQFINRSYPVALRAPSSFKWEFFRAYNKIALETWRKYVPELVVMDAAALALARPDLHILAGRELTKSDCLHYWKKDCSGHRAMNHWWITLLFNILNARSMRSRTANKLRLSDSDSALTPGIGSEHLKPSQDFVVKDERCLTASVRDEKMWLQNPAGYVPSYDVIDDHDNQDAGDVFLNSTTYQSCHEEHYRGILARSLVFHNSTTFKGTTASIGAKIDLCSSENYGCQNKRHQGPVPRVAHCIAGSARTFWHPRVYKRLQDNFIDALGGNYTTFMYLKLTDSKVMFYNRIKMKKNEKTFSPKLESLSAALAYMKPYKVIFAPEKKTSVYDSRESGCSLVEFDPVMTGNFIGQLDTLRDCYRMVEDFEKSEGARFDFVTRIRPDSAVLRPVQSVHTLSSAKIYLPARDDGNIDRTLSIAIDHIGIFGRLFSDDFFHMANIFYSACPDGTLTWLKLNSRGPKVWAEKRPEILTKIPIPVILIRASPEDMETVCRNWVKIHPAIFGGTETSVWTQWLNKAQDKCLNETTLLTGVADALHSTFNLSASVRPNSDLPPPPFYSKNCENLFAENERKAAYFAAKPLNERQIVVSGGHGLPITIATKKKGKTRDGKRYKSTTGRPLRSATTAKQEQV